jgi:hypothetical protein
LVDSASPILVLFKTEEGDEETDETREEKASGTFSRATAAGEGFFPFFVFAAPLFSQSKTRKGNRARAQITRTMWEGVSALGLEEVPAAEDDEEEDPHEVDLARKPHSAARRATRVSPSLPSKEKGSTLLPLPPPLSPRPREPPLALSPSLLPPPPRAERGEA